MLSRIRRRAGGWASRIEVGSLKAALRIVLMGRRDDRPPPTASGRPASRRGIALIIVLSAVAILTMLTMEFRYRSHVNLRMAANMRDELKARYLAYSSENFTHLIMHLQRTVDTMIPKNMNVKIELWKIMNQIGGLNSDLLRAFSGGVMAQQQVLGGILSQFQPADEQMDSASGTGAFGDAAGDLTGVEGVRRRAAELTDEQKEDIVEKTGFGDFDGSFFAHIEDEDSKLNLNAYSPKEIQALALELKSLFTPDELDTLFERRDERGNYLSREDTIAALIDWIDADAIKFGTDSSDENTLYNFEEDDPYKPKNALFDSLDEVQLVWGVDDRFWQIFRDAFTVYRMSGSDRRRVNINTADPLVLAGLLRMCTNTNPTEEQIRQTLDQVLKYRDEETFGGMGFSSAADFENLVTQYTQFDITKGCLSQNAGTEATIFRVQAIGQVGDVSITIELIMDKNGTIYYWRSI